MRLQSNHSPGRKAGIFRSQQSFGALLCAIVLLIFTVAAEAQPAKAKPAVPTSSNRYLFIVDTSSSMKTQITDINKVVDEIVLSGASGQLHAGDSIGLWTFNEETYSDLPMQIWGNNTPEQIAKRTTDFIRQQHFQKKSRLDRVLPDLLTLVRNSDILTLFIISNGEGKMSGTPFDQDINTSVEQAVQDMVKAHRKPVVAVLQAKGGKLLQFTVNAVPWPVVIPELPIQVVAPTAATDAAPVKPAPVAVKPRPTPNPNPAPIATPPLPTPPVAPANRLPAGTKLHNGTTVPPLPGTTEPAPSIQPPANVPAAITPTPQAVVPVNPVPTVSPAVVPQANVPTPAQPQNPTLTALQRGPANQSPLKPQNSQPPPAIPKFTLPAPPQAATAAPASAPPTFNPLDLPGAPHPTPRIPVPPPMSQVNSNEAAKAAMAATNSFGARALAYITPNLNGRSNSYLVAGVILILVAICLILIMVRRARSANSGPSFITQSINNEKR